MATTPSRRSAARRSQPARDQQLVAGRARNTRQARAIEAALGEADGFRTAYDLFAQIRDTGQRIGLSTIYRHLSLLADTDRADVVHGADGEALYRLCGPPEATGPAEHHHHIVCRLCGRSVELPGAEIEAWAARVAAESGYSDITHTVELFGLCPQHSNGRRFARPAGRR
jgi:Fur family ferric uptake transcriptional regulator